MTAARQPAQADKTEIWGLLWGGASVPTEASGANPLAEQSPNAGATDTMTPGQSSLHSVAPSRKRGRPHGSYKPLGKWMRAQITKYKRQGQSCSDTFRALSYVEGGDDVGFAISDETGDAWERDVGANIAGSPVSYDSFRKMWNRVEIF